MARQDAPQDLEPAGLRISRHYPVAPEKVWRAWTQAEALSRWFGPANVQGPTEADIDLREGGKYVIRFRTDDGVMNQVGGEYLEVRPHTRLQFSWAWHSTPERVSRITIDFVPEPGGTRMDFVHDRFVDAQAAQNHARGWGAAFGKLDAFILS